MEIGIKVTVALTGGRYHQKQDQRYDARQAYLKLNGDEDENFAVDELDSVISCIHLSVSTGGRDLASSVRYISMSPTMYV